jgi:TetR/AcrR family transcriptional regulator, transcriptional repressor for nem operon
LQTKRSVFMSDGKEHILQTAFTLFLQKSFKEVTMKEIVEKTGMSKGAFYHYFKSKEDLFVEIIDKYYGTFAAIDYNNFNHESLVQFYHEYLEYIETGLKDLSEIVGGVNETNTINYFLMMFDAINILPGFREKSLQMMQKELKSWENIIQIARGKGEIKSPMTDTQIARLFTSSNDGISIHVIMLGRANDLKKEILDVWDGFYNHLKA